VQKKCIIIWSYQKKAVPLHPLLRNKRISLFRRKVLKFRIAVLRGSNFFAPIARKQVERLENSNADAQNSNTENQPITKKIRKKLLKIWSIQK